MQQSDNGTYCYAELTIYSLAPLYLLQNCNKLRTQLMH